MSQWAGDGSSPGAGQGPGPRFASRGPGPPPASAAFRLGSSGPPPCCRWRVGSGPRQFPGRAARESESGRARTLRDRRVSAEPEPLRSPESGSRSRLRPLLNGHPLAPRPASLRSRALPAPRAGRCTPASGPAGRGAHRGRGRGCTSGPANPAPPETEGPLRPADQLEIRLGVKRPARVNRPAPPTRRSRQAAARPTAPQAPPEPAPGPARPGSQRRPASGEPGPGGGGSEGALAGDARGEAAAVEADAGVERRGEAREGAALVAAVEQRAQGAAGRVPLEPDLVLQA
jgi:hypothetical protein